MTVHITGTGVLAVIGGAVVFLAVLYILYGLWVLWRWGK